MLKLLFCLLLCHSLVFAKEEAFDFEITDGLENIDKKEKKDFEIDIGSAKIINLEEEVDNIYVADSSIADIIIDNPKSVYVQGNKIGKTSVFATTKKGKQVLSINVSVKYNMNELKKMIEQLIPSAVVTPISSDVNIILKGKVLSQKDLHDIENLANKFLINGGAIINHLTVVKPTQVSLRVKVAEIRRDVAKQMGINWDAFSTITTSILNSFALGIGRDIINFAQTGLAIRGLGQDRNIYTDSDGNKNAEALRSSADVPSMYLNMTTGNHNIHALIDALVGEDYALLLAEPNLTALSGNEAVFFSGGEIPITVSQAQGMQTTEFKQFGVKLTFKPTVLDNNLIKIEVHPEVSSISGSPSTSNYQILKREVKTVVEMASGQSFAIGGLIEKRDIASMKSMPILGKLPGVLGSMFRSKKFEKSETELVIIITPYIVEPSNDMLITPIDNLESESGTGMLMGNRVFKKDR